MNRTDFLKKYRSPQFHDFTTSIEEVNLHWKRHYDDWGLILPELESTGDEDCVLAFKVAPEDLADGEKFWGLFQQVAIGEYWNRVMPESLFTLKQIPPTAVAREMINGWIRTTKKVPFEGDPAVKVVLKTRRDFTG